MIISMILAVSENGVIGRKNQLPWKKISADLRHFKRITAGHSVIMGRKTYESLGKALPKRRNIVVTRNRDWQAEDAEVFHSLEAAIAACNGETEIFIIGGSTIYNKALEMGLAQRIHLTRIHETFSGDTFFTLPKDGRWQVQAEEKQLADEKNPYDYTFFVYEWQE